MTPRSLPPPSPGAGGGGPLAVARGSLRSGLGLAATRSSRKVVEVFTPFGQVMRRKRHTVRTFRLFVEAWGCLSGVLAYHRPALCMLEALKEILRIGRNSNWKVLRPESALSSRGLPRHPRGARKGQVPSSAFQGAGRQGLGEESRAGPSPARVFQIRGSSTGPAVWNEPPGSPG